MFILLLCIVNNFPDSGMEIIDFATFDNDVHRAFKALFDMFQAELHRATYARQFTDIRRLCMLSANENFRRQIKQVQNMESLLDLLAENTVHCNWIKIEILEAIARRSRELQKLLQKYKEVIFSKKLREIWAYLPHILIRNKYYQKLKSIFNDKDPDDTTLGEIRKYSKVSLPTTDLDDFIIEFCHNCLSVTWLVPTNKVHQYFLSAFTIPQRSRQEDYLQIGAWVVYHPQSVLQKLKVEFG